MDNTPRLNAGPIYYVEWMFGKSLAEIRVDAEAGKYSDDVWQWLESLEYLQSVIKEEE